MDADSTLVAPPLVTPVRYAGFVSRLLAYLLDLAIVGGVAAVTTTAGQFLGQSLGLRSPTLILLAVITSAVNVVVYLAYYIGFLAVAGQTPGKRLLGLRVRTTKGEPLSARQALRRLLASWLSLPLFWGYFMVLLDDRRQTFHDKFARTVVLYDRGLN